MTEEEKREFFSAPKVTTSETVIYSKNGRPYKCVATVVRRCSEDPEAALENFLRVAGRIAERVEQRAIKEGRYEELKAKVNAKEKWYDK